MRCPWRHVCKGGCGRCVGCRIEHLTLLLTVAGWCLLYVGTQGRSFRRAALPAAGGGGALPKLEAHSLCPYFASLFWSYICDELTAFWCGQNPMLKEAGVLGSLAAAQHALVGNAKGPGAVSYAGAVMCVLSCCYGVINLRLRQRSN